MTHRPQTFRRLTRRRYGRAMNRARRAGRCRSSIERIALVLARGVRIRVADMMIEAAMTGRITLYGGPLPGQTGHFV